MPSAAPVGAADPATVIGVAESASLHLVKGPSGREDRFRRENVLRIPTFPYHYAVLPHFHPARVPCLDETEARGCKTEWATEWILSVGQVQLVGPDGATEKPAAGRQCGADGGYNAEPATAAIASRPCPLALCGTQATPATGGVHAAACCASPPHGKVAERSCCVPSTPVCYARTGGAGSVVWLPVDFRG